ncbi:Iron-sulfur cluster carrier protein [anaerobic digester metagenome]
MFIDMPPDTGDVPLTVFQSIPVDGLVIVASPQELMGMMNVPALALVENMSYVVCPDCGREIHVFGESRIAEIAQKHSIQTTAYLPIDSKLAVACDAGTIEHIDGNRLNSLLDIILI